MRSVSDYRADVLTIVGDAAGRRYSESILDMGLREALGEYRKYYPRKELIRTRVTGFEAGGKSAVVPWLLDASAEVLSVRSETDGEELNAACYAEPGRLIITSPWKTFRMDEVLRITVSVPHMVKGLDEAKQTTVPESHALSLATGAAGYAMRIRARSVTEVFGKRPEDREALSHQADGLIADFTRRVEKIALHESFQRAPYPRKSVHIRQGDGS